MISPRPILHRQRLLAHVACLACRRLKMKCIGAEDPPCQRCRKAGRECIAPGNSQQSSNSQVSIPRNSENTGHPSYTTQPSNNWKNAEFRPGNSTPNVTPQDGYRFGGVPQASAQSEDLSFPSNFRSLEDARIPPNHAYGQGQNQSTSSPLTTTTSHTINFILDATGSPLPSVYSVAPIDLVDTMSVTDSPHGTLSTAESNSITSPSSTGKSRGQNTNISKPIDEHQIFDLIIFFNQKLLHNLPFITDETKHDVPNIIRDKRPLAICAAFVASRFVPGYKSLRDELVPEIMQILDQRYCPPGNGPVYSWTLLQAFCVLYAYATTQSSNCVDSCLTGGLSKWALRSTVEMFAGRLELNRSAEVLHASIKAGTVIDNQSKEVRRYILWLWIFSMSHYSSLLLRAPPTIIIDSNIRSAGKLLGNLDLDARSLRIVAEVELCSLWHYSTTLDQAASEWWCSSSDPADVESTLATLERFEKAIETWRERWLPDDPSHNIERRPAPTIRFHYRFTRFCMSTYATRLTYQPREATVNSKNTENFTSPPIIRLMFQSIEAAADLCAHITSLSPLQRDHSRYLADSAFSMICFPCFYIIRAAELLSKNATVSMEGHLKTVEVVANTILALAVDSNHGASVYGKAVLERLSAYRLQESRTIASQNVEFLSNQHSNQTGSEAAGAHGELPAQPLSDTSQLPGNTGAGVFDQHFENMSWDMSSQQDQMYSTYTDWFADASIESSVDTMAAFNGAWLIDHYD